MVASGHILTIDGTQTIGTNGPNASASAPTCSASAGSTTTSLPSGNYAVRIVPVSAGGVEGSASIDVALSSIVNGSSTPRITLPSLPTGATAWNIYITNTNTSTGGVTHRRYATNKTTSFDPTSASWEDGTVAFSSATLIAPASGIWGVGTYNLAAGASLTAKGDLINTNTSGTTMSAGSTLTFSVPSSQTFYWAGSVTNGVVSPLIINGTTGSHCTVTKTGSGSAALTGFAPISPNGSGNVRATYTDFSSLGTASINAINFKCYTGGDAFTLDHCTFTACGQTAVSNGQTNQNTSITNCRWTGSLNSNTISLDASTGWVSGTRTFTNNIVDNTLIFLNGSARFTVEDNYLNDGLTSSGAATGRTWLSFRRNFVARTTSAGSVQPATYDFTDCIIFVNSSSVANPHPFDPSGVNENRVWSGCVFDAIVYDNTGDLLLPSTTTPASNYTLTVKNCLFLPNVLGDNIGTPLTAYGNSKLGIIFNHNTYIMGTQGVSYGEAGGYTGYAGMWQSFRSNIAWNPAKLSTGYVMWDALGTTFDAVAGSVTNVDYNGKYNYATTTTTASPDATALARGYHTGSSGGSNYAFAAATTPGDHDVSANPSFVDSTRSLALFDQQYLGKPVGTAWSSSSVSYVVGDIVSATTSGVFFGQTVNYRCITAHTSTSGTGATAKPGNGTLGSPQAWSTNWELASQYWIRESVVAGTTYTDKTIGAVGVSMIEVARLWLRAGFAPTNSSYRVAGHDSAVLGAVNFNKTTRSLTKLTALRSGISTRYGVSV